MKEVEDELSERCIEGSGIFLIWAGRPIMMNSINQSINNYFRLFKNRNDIAALMFTNLSMIKQYYTIKLKVS